ncbi:P2X purinoceptor 4-like, partial [Seriola lalandi dorsalis]
GGILGIIIDWSCDLDWWAGKCYPKYSFHRLDNKNPVNNVAPGYNFRFAKYYKAPDGEETRTLIKAYGIRFDVIVFGTAGKFSIVPTIVNLGAALSFLSLVPVVSDWIMLTCTKKKDLYGKLKATYLSEDAEAEAMSMGTSYGTQ